MSGKPVPTADHAPLRLLSQIQRLNPSVRRRYCRCPSSFNQPITIGCPIHVAVSSRHGWVCRSFPILLLPLSLQLFFSVCHPEGDPLCLLTVLSKPQNPSKRHLDRSTGQSHRPVRSGRSVALLASKVQRGFSPASKAQSPPRSGHHSAEGRSEGEAEATDLSLLLLHLSLLVRQGADPKKLFLRFPHISCKKSATQKTTSHNPPYPPNPPHPVHKNTTSKRRFPQNPSKNANPPHKKFTAAK